MLNKIECLTEIIGEEGSLKITECEKYDLIIKLSLEGCNYKGAYIVLCNKNGNGFYNVSYKVFNKKDGERSIRSQQRTLSYKNLKEAERSFMNILYGKLFEELTIR